MIIYSNFKNRNNFDNQNILIYNKKNNTLLKKEFLAIKFYPHIIRTVPINMKNDFIREFFEKKIKPNPLNIHNIFFLPITKNSHEKLFNKGINNSLFKTEMRKNNRKSIRKVKSNVKRNLILGASIIAGLIGGIYKLKNINKSVNENHYTFKSMTTKNSNLFSSPNPEIKEHSIQKDSNALSLDDTNRQNFSTSLSINKKNKEKKVPYQLLIPKISINNNIKKNSDKIMFQENKSEQKKLSLLENNSEFIKGKIQEVLPQENLILLQSKDQNFLENHSSELSEKETLNIKKNDMMKKNKIIIDNKTENQDIQEEKLPKKETIEVNDNIQNFQSTKKNLTNSHHSIVSNPSNKKSLLANKSPNSKQNQLSFNKNNSNAKERKVESKISEKEKILINRNIIKEHIKATDRHSKNAIQNSQSLISKDPNTIQAENYRNMIDKSNNEFAGYHEQLKKELEEERSKFKKLIADKSKDLEVAKITGETKKIVTLQREFDTYAKVLQENQKDTNYIEEHFKQYHELMARNLKKDKNISSQEKAKKHINSAQGKINSLTEDEKKKQKNSQIRMLSHYKNQTQIQ